MLTHQNQGHYLLQVNAANAELTCSREAEIVAQIDTGLGIIKTATPPNATFATATPNCIHLLAPVKSFLKKNKIKNN